MSVRELAVEVESLSGGQSKNQQPQETEGWSPFHGVSAHVHLTSQQLEFLAPTRSFAAAPSGKLRKIVDDLPPFGFCPMGYDVHPTEHEVVHVLNPSRYARKPPKRDRVFSDNGVLLARRCSNCHEVLPVEQFYRARCAWDGYAAWCISCTKIRRRKYPVPKTRQTLSRMYSR